MRSLGKWFGSLIRTGGTTRHGLQAVRCGWAGTDRVAMRAASRWLGAGQGGQSWCSGMCGVQECVLTLSTDRHPRDQRAGLASNDAVTALWGIDGHGEHCGRSSTTDSTASMPCEAASWTHHLRRPRPPHRHRRRQTLSRHSRAERAPPRRSTPDQAGSGAVLKHVRGQSPYLHPSHHRLGSGGVQRWDEGLERRCAGDALLSVKRWARGAGYLMRGVPQLVMGQGYRAGQSVCALSSEGTC